MYATPTIKADDVIKIKQRNSITFTFIGFFGLKVHFLKAPVLNLIYLLTCMKMFMDTNIL
jgi:hypothetical protein